LKLVKNHYHCNARLQFFSQHVNNWCNSLLQDEVVNSFKSRLEKRLSRLMDFFKDL